jgi:hypothetical protein
MKYLCGEPVTDEEFAQSAPGSVENELRILKAIVRRMRAGEDVGTLLDSVLPIIADIERLELQRAAILAACNWSMH